MAVDITREERANTAKAILDTGLDNWLVLPREGPAKRILSKKVLEILVVLQCFLLPYIGAIGP